MLVKLPVDVTNAWKPLFENGGVEFTRNTGARDIEPRVELGMLMDEQGGFKQGATLSLVGQDGKYLQYRVNLRESTGMRMRVISAEVGPTGQNVKFEGEIAQQGNLIPMAADEDYKHLLKARVDANEKRAQVNSVTRREEQQIIREQGRTGIKGANNGDNDDFEEIEEKKVTKKSKKTKKTGAAAGGAAAAAPTKKKKPARKKDKDLSADAIKKALYACFEKTDPNTGEKMRYWKRKDLRRTTGIQQHKMQPILDQICDYNEGGPHDKTYSLKYTADGAQQGL